MCAFVCVCVCVCVYKDHLGNVYGLLLHGLVNHRTLILPVWHTHTHTHTHILMLKSQLLCLCAHLPCVCAGSTGVYSVYVRACLCLFV